MASPIRYRTLSGYPLEFNPYPQSGDWRDVSGVYCFAYMEGDTWRILYAGQARSFQGRIPTHERWVDARQRGATHVLAMVVSLQADRDKIEEALIAELQPPLNTQLK